MILLRSAHLTNVINFNQNSSKIANRRQNYPYLLLPPNTS